MDQQGRGKKGRWRSGAKMLQALKGEDGKLGAVMDRKTMMGLEAGE